MESWELIRAWNQSLGLKQVRKLKSVQQQTYKRISQELKKKKRLLNTIHARRLDASIFIQKMVKGWLARKQYEVKLLSHLREKALSMCDSIQNQANLAWIRSKTYSEAQKVISRGVVKWRFLKKIQTLKNIYNSFKKQKVQYAEQRIKILILSWRSRRLKRLFWIEKFKQKSLLRIRRKLAIFTIKKFLKKNGLTMAKILLKIKRKTTKKRSSVRPISRLRSLIPTFNQPPQLPVNVFTTISSQPSNFFDTKSEQFSVSSRQLQKQFQQEQQLELLKKAYNIPPLNQTQIEPRFFSIQINAETTTSALNKMNTANRTPTPQSRYCLTSQHRKTPVRAVFRYPTPKKSVYQSFDANFLKSTQSSKNRSLSTTPENKRQKINTPPAVRLLALTTSSQLKVRQKVHQRVFRVKKPSQRPKSQMGKSFNNSRRVILATPPPDPLTNSFRRASIDFTGNISCFSLENPSNFSIQYK